MKVCQKKGCNSCNEYKSCFPLDIKFTIPLNSTTKKNSQQIIKTKYGKRAIIQSDRYLQYEKDCKIFIEMAKAKHNIKEPINSKINITYKFYRKDKHMCDLNGLIQAMDDILVKHGLIKDDNYNIVAGHDNSRVFIDKENPRIEIEIDGV